MQTFPLFIKTQNRLAVVIGAGKIGARRAAALAECGFDVLVAAPEIPPELLGLPIKFLRERYSPPILNGAFLVVAATNDRELNHAIGERAHEIGALVSVADCESECDFYFPALAKGENILAGITGNGCNHSAVAEAAAKIRKVIS